MADVKVEILNFMRDAQYRVAELTNEINLDNSLRRSEKQDRRELRQQLFLLMNLVYISRYKIHGEYLNFLRWTDAEILSEIEHVRALADMNPVPALSFPGYSPNIVKKTVDEGGGESYAGSPNRIFGWDANGNPVSYSFTQLPGYTPPPEPEPEVYDDPTPINNPIGSASGDLSGLSAIDILKRVLNQYQTPAVSNAKNNAGGTYYPTVIKEIGQAINGNVGVTYSVSNNSNLEGETPINITAGGIFSNEGDFANGPVSLIPAAPLNPSTLKTYTINIKATHKEGVSNIAKTYIRYDCRLIWGVWQTEVITAVQANSLIAKLTRLTNTPVGEYAFNAAGYPFLLVPIMLSMSGKSFLEVSTPGLSSPYPLKNTGVVLTINNTVGTYDYAVWRGDFYYNVNTKLKVQ